MRCVEDTDVARFAAVVLPWLGRDPVMDNTIYTVIASRAGGQLPTTRADRWLRVLDGDDLVGVATLIPPQAVLLSTMPIAAAQALAEHFAAKAGSDRAGAAADTHQDSDGLPGVGGPTPLAGAFAERYTALTGRGHSLGLDMGCFRLDAVQPPAPVAGRLRAAEQRDRDLLVEWYHAFHAEAVPFRAGSDPAPYVDGRLAEGGLLWLWEDTPGATQGQGTQGQGTRPVTLVGSMPPAAGVIRIAPVYTPPAYRGRGYASAAVAAVCQRALDRGARALTLNTDLTNGTSNRIYQRVGFRRVGDVREWRFTSDHR